MSLLPQQLLRVGGACLGPGRRGWFSVLAPPVLTADPSFPAQASGTFLTPWPSLSQLLPHTAPCDEIVGLFFFPFLPPVLSG